MSYLSPADYGLIGNASSVALISRNGSVDWLCFPNLDSPAHFTAYFGEGQGTGRFQICPHGDFRSEQRYLPRSLVLETEFETPTGRAVLTDWMPMPLANKDASHADPTVRRRIEVLEGEIAWILHCSPRFGYGAHPGMAERMGEPRGSGVLFRGAPVPGSGEIAALSCDVPLTIDGSGLAATSRFTLKAGETRDFLWSWGRRKPELTLPTIEATLEHWQSIAHRCPPGTCPFAGPWHDLIARSGLITKALTASFSGAISEAATTSIPGLSRGTRTWDYRYASMREGALTLQALTALGLENEAHEYFHWVADILIRDGAENLQAMYTLDGGRILMERESALMGMESFSSPYGSGLRTHVTRRFQLDLYGHAMLAAQEYHRIFGSLPDGLWPRLTEIADIVCHAWRRPDHGPWEMRTRPEHYVISKLYCWAALESASSLAAALGVEIPIRWKQESAILHRMICEQGYDAKRNTFVRAFGEQELDAHLLKIPLLGFLPFDDPRVMGTIAAIQAELGAGPLLFRTKAGPGEVPSVMEGAHLQSSLLLVTCLAQAGRANEASDHLAEICSFATPLGLFAEQVHPATGEPMGNFPCEIAHLSLIYAGLSVAQARGRRVPAIPKRSASLS